MLKLDNITKEYNLSKGNKVFALKDINLSIESSGLLAIVGKSGSGKTTLLNMLGGLDEPTYGTIAINGIELDHKNSRQLDLYRNYTVSFIFQDFNLLEDYSVLENIKLGVKLQGVNNSEANTRAKAALEQVGLAGYENRKISTLSGGQKQRVAIARALCKDSEIVLCDEPTGNLDSKTSNEIFSLIKTLSANRVFVIVTHDEESAIKYADRLVKISDGKIIIDVDLSKPTSDTADKIKEKTANTRKKKIFGLGLKNCLHMVRHNITHSLFSTIAMFLLLAICFTLSSVFVSLSQYEEKEAFLTTIRANDQYMLSITKYSDRVIQLPNNDFVYGYQPIYSSVDESDMDIIKQFLPKEISMYPSYYFAKPFTDYKNIEINEYSDVGYAFSFKEAIVVKDFGSFQPRLSKGSKPVEDNDVLIYDFLAQSLIERGIVSGDMDSLVGYTLTDSVTGMQMRISGILASKYQNYLNTPKSSSSYDFAVSYLSGLRAVYCKPAFIEYITTYSQYLSIVDSNLVSYSDDYDIDNRVTGVGTKIVYTDISNITFFAVSATAAEQDELDYGVVISRNTLARLMKKSVSDITREEAAKFIDTYDDFYYNILVSDADLSPVGTVMASSQIIAVCNEDTGNDELLYFCSSDGFEMPNKNGEFRQIYLGLCDDWQINKSVIEEFWYPEEKPYEFYIKHPNYYDEIFADYDPVGFLIREANYYLLNVKETATIINYIVLGMSALVVIIYTIFTLKKFNYKIGVLKALGAKTSNIILIFGLQLLLISLLAFLLSVPLSVSVLALINAAFVKEFATEMVFFATTFSSVMVALAFATLGIAIVSGIPLVKLAFTSPTKTIAASRNKS